MDLFYRFIIYIHVVSVVASIGPFFILLPILKKLRHAIEPELSVQLDMCRSVVRLSKHSGHVLVLTGILLVWLGPWTWKTPWIVMTLLLMFCSLFFLARAFTPTLRKFHERNQDRAVLVSTLKQSIWTYILLLMAMLWFMVVKPPLW